MSTTQLLQTAIKTQSALSSIGTSPYSSDGNSIKGEDTDGLVNHVKNSWLYTIALGGVASAGAQRRRRIPSVVDRRSTIGGGMPASCFSISHSFLVYSEFTIVLSFS